MKKTKILVPALGILALGMAASVTGTVAWFSANDKVYADGIFIQTTTAQSLVISESGNDHTWGSKITHAQGHGTTQDPTAAKSMDPAYNLSANNAVPSFVKVDSGTLEGENPTYEVRDDGKVYPYGSGEAGQPVAPAAAGTGPWIACEEDTDYLQLEEYLKLDTQDTTTNVSVALSLTAQAENSHENIDKALVVGVFVWSGESAGTLTSVKPFAGGASTYTNNLGLSPLTINYQPTHVSVYVWYDGQDAACINANAIEHPITISLTWSVQ